VNRVTVFARTNNISASKKEFEYAKIDGVKFEYNKVPVEIKDDGILVRNLDCDEGDYAFYPAASNIISIGQGPRNRIVSTTEGIDINPRGLLITDSKGATTRAGIFASGDVVLGAKTVVEAVAYSRYVADSIDEYITLKYMSYQEQTQAKEDNL